MKLEFWWFWRFWWIGDEWFITILSKSQKPSWIKLVPTYWTGILCFATWIRCCMGTSAFETIVQRSFFLFILEVYNVFFKFGETRVIFSFFIDVRALQDPGFCVSSLAIIFLGTTDIDFRIHANRWRGRWEAGHRANLSNLISRVAEDLAVDEFCAT